MFAGTCAKPSESARIVLLRFIRHLYWLIPRHIGSALGRQSCHGDDGQGMTGSAILLTLGLLDKGRPPERGVGSSRYAEEVVGSDLT